jgi:ParB-like nuclease family protein
MEVEISRLLEHSPVGVGRHLDEDRVRRYSELLDQLPPVTVFALEDRTLLLADGYHRVAAAQRAGRSTIRAEVRLGTRAQAIQFAVGVARTERGVSAEQARDAIRRHSGGERSGQPDQPS